MRQIFLRMSGAVRKWMELGSRPPHPARVLVGSSGVRPGASGAGSYSPGADNKKERRAARTGRRVYHFATLMRFFAYSLEPSNKLKTLA